MAGQPIRRAYEAKIEKIGIQNILQRVEDGENLKTIAEALGMSRTFLSTYLNRDAYTADALHLCRALAARARLAAYPMGVGRSGVRHWIENAPALHLAALKRLRREALGEPVTAVQALLRRNTGA